MAAIVLGCLIASLLAGLIGVLAKKKKTSKQGVVRLESERPAAAEVEGAEKQASPVSTVVSEMYHSPRVEHIAELEGLKAHRGF